VIGIAWVPSLMQAGGICERYRYYPASASLPGGTYSLNTLIVSQRTGSSRLVGAMTSLTLSHELGHSFGALHDDDFRRRDCLPGTQSRYGNYIMAATAATGYQAHNWMFSRCSRQSMASVMMYWIKTRCLRPRKSTYCGNAIVEGHEQCDCGTTYSCHVHDKCCTPVQLPSGLLSEPQTAACKLNDWAACSPRTQRCCTSQCVVASAGVTCRKATSCSLASQCDGRSPSCPPPSLVADGTPCADGRGQCEGGVCSVSPCQQAGLVDCLCRQPLNHACSVCCRCDEAPDEACVPAQWLNINHQSDSLLLPPGSRCVDRGHCDNDARCVPFTALHYPDITSSAPPDET